MGTSVRPDYSLLDEISFASPCAFARIDECDSVAEWAAYLVHCRNHCGVVRYYCSLHKEHMEQGYINWVAGAAGKNCPDCLGRVSPLLSDNFRAIRL